ncbi:MAG: DUF4160 domain-containing protein [Treponema sp.]|nr:DUF4160 domain-containing protein [Candidatus Treponema caballi]
MPELSRFEGMVIYMLFRDNQEHNKPHVHVYYGEYEASIGIDGELLSGRLPQRQMKMIVGWLALHEEEAYAAWNLAVSGEHFQKIAPM